MPRSTSETDLRGRNLPPSERPERLFFLGAPTATGEPQLDAADAHHARKVLRLEVGDTLSGLDGQGGLWPLRVSSVARRGLTVEVNGAARLDPQAGEAGAPLPWIEVAVAWPKGPRAETMVGGLTQLGAAAIRALSSQRTLPLDATGDRAARRRERALRTARESCKQCRRTWVPTLEPLTAVDELPVGPGTAILDPRAEVGLDAWAQEQAAAWLRSGTYTSAQPLRLVVGPEGGWTASELEALTQRGALSVRLSPFVLRIENAAQAGLAVLVAACDGAKTRRSHD